MLTVIKFGGSSLSTAEKIDNAASVAAETKRNGSDVVVVVSARGDTTDELIKQAVEVSDNPEPREKDALLATGEQISAALLAIKLCQMKTQALSLSAWQAGIETDDNHGSARIVNIHTSRIRQELERGKIVIVTGFQGVSGAGDITTIGRGGSDTSAVALAAALKAEKCVIYTDVDGVYSSDPRYVPSAFKHDRIGYNQMLEMASLGAGVLHNRSVELAKKHSVPLWVKSAYRSNGGTEITAEAMEGGRISGVVCDNNTALVEVFGVGVESLPKILTLFAENQITSDMFTDIGNRLGITVPEEKAQTALNILSNASNELGLASAGIDCSVAKVSLVGCGLGTDPTVAARMLLALKNAGIDVKSLVAGEIKISALVAQTLSQKATSTLHKEFFSI